MQVTDATDKGSKKAKKQRPISEKAKLEETPCDDDDDLEEEANFEEGFIAGRTRSSSQLENALTDSLLAHFDEEDSDDDRPLA
jgi:hypothetical protein